ncbi:PREDICTED: ubiquitin carboxyl-terminal hydrolase 47-like [Amphimedon queenslandica]|uniref:Ubiquitin carboxyl-terminal hydrolase 47 C-terminal domain-containing protein n=1 Tax=Amphimedon queenslandica TaxID=400682 RepID=A0AAN0JNP8_AMPQE|nr:PREDICTED: ubiquitin carboxyl-terminal hydrolase 47-like [Amphimedon queenslandica]|eukprot:XP_019858401.1 PREDICTED: ubiquitin carboxyl-terminal hydrolase 47-like [Amphimedon queenslandica]
MNQSFDLDEYQYQTIGQIMSVTRYLQVFLETRINLEVSVVDLSTVEVVPAEPVRGELGWTDGELKQHIGEEFSINPSCMRIVVEEYNYINNVTSVHDVSIVGEIQVQVSNSITLDQLKEELVPLIGVPPTGFRVYEIKKYDRRYDSDDEEYELGGLDEILMNIGIKSGSELIVRLGRTVLQEGEKRIKLYLLQVNNTEFCTFMMESIYAEGYTQVREFKRQIIEEAKEQGIDCVLELDKMRLRDKKGVSPGRVYLHDELIDTYSTYKYSKEMYVEPLKGPEKMKHYTQMQVYVIRWRPSQCSVDPIEEIILDKRYDPKDFIGKLSELSGIPFYNIYYTESKSFPVMISCLDIENELRWYSINLDRYYSLRLYDDGRVIYYKDKRETMKELTDEERYEIEVAEEARLERIRD